MFTYLIVNIASVLVPAIAAFHKRIQFYRHWKPLLGATFLSLIPFILWDIYFTNQGFWGFNSDYLTGIELFNLPFEEWMFFICIPFACTFSHFTLTKLLPQAILSKRSTWIITSILFIIFTALALFNISRNYTLWVSLFCILILLSTMLFKFELLQRFYWTFLFMLIPFFIVNGILTGTGIENEVVWYNNMENLGLRILTIPVEDSLYAFGLLLLNIFLFELIKKKGLT